MSKRRTFGRIRKLPSGRFQARFPTPGGELITADRTFQTRPEAARFLSEVETDQHRGTWVDHRLSRIRLRDYVSQWIKHRKLRPSTVARYGWLLDRHILPRFGDLTLGEITAPAVRSWNAELAAKHPDTAAQAYRLLSAIFNTVVADDLLIRSPCRGQGCVTVQEPRAPNPVYRRDRAGCGSSRRPLSTCHSTRSVVPASAGRDPGAPTPTCRSRRRHDHDRSDLDIGQGFHGPRASQDKRWKPTALGTLKRPGRPRRSPRSVCWTGRRRLAVRRYHGSNDHRPDAGPAMEGGARSDR